MNAGGFPPDFSFGEQKRLLGEVVHKIKVDSKARVHLFLRSPERASSFGLTVQYGSPLWGKTQNAGYFYRTKITLLGYYNKDL